MYKYSSYFEKNYINIIFIIKYYYVDRSKRINEKTISLNSTCFHLKEKILMLYYQNIRTL
jgi:hypothetical protein